MHRVGIEGARHTPGATGIEREIGAAVDDPVKIVALHRGRARVEIVGHAFGRENGNRVRTQMRVERVANGIDIPLFRQIDMSDLSARVHTCVSAPGALHKDFVARQCLDRQGQHALHGELLGLNLPAGKRRAVIFDDELVPGHELACDHRM